MGDHIDAQGRWQSDKYPQTPADLVPLSVHDKTAQPLLWKYAQIRRAKDAGFSDDLEMRLRQLGYDPDRGEETRWISFEYDDQKDQDDREFLGWTVDVSMSLVGGTTTKEVNGVTCHEHQEAKWCRGDVYFTNDEAGQLRIRVSSRLPEEGNNGAPWPFHPVDVVLNDPGDVTTIARACIRHMVQSNQVNHWATHERELAAMSREEIIVKYLSLLDGWRVTNRQHTIVVDASAMPDRSGYRIIISDSQADDARLEARLSTAITNALPPAIDVDKVRSDNEALRAEMQALRAIIHNHEKANEQGGKGFVITRTERGYAIYCPGASERRIAAIVQAFQAGQDARMGVMMLQAGTGLTRTEAERMMRQVVAEVGLGRLPEADSVSQIAGELTSAGDGTNGAANG